CLAGLKLNAAGHQRDAARQRFLDAVKPQCCKSPTAHARAHPADAAVAGHHGCASLWRGAIEADRNNARAGNCAMLDAGNDLLTDKTAFVEVNAMELVHVALVWKGIAIDEIDAAAGYTKCEAMGLVA